MVSRSVTARASTAGSSRVSPRAAFWVSFLLLFVVIAGWSVTNPAMASPDEPAHAVKAAATVRGEFFADESGYTQGRGEFEVPELFYQGWTLGCFAFHSEMPASCSPRLTGDLGAPRKVVSHVARYNPIYYAIIGGPSLIPSQVTFTLMRLISALLNALLLALAVRSVAELRRPRWPLAGVVVAATPMTIFIASSMTPQGPEISGAILTAVLLLALTRDSDPELLDRRMWRLVVATLFFVTSRGLSPAYLALIVVFVLLAIPRLDVVRDLLRTRRVWPQIILCLVISLAATSYTLLTDALTVGFPFPDPSLTVGSVIATMTANTPSYLEQCLGVFGFGDTHLPMWALVVIGGMVAIVVLVGLAAATWRERVVIVLVFVTVLVLPILLQLASFRQLGIIWQGKYILPIAVLLPILAGFVAERGPIGDAISAKTVAALLAVAATMQVVAFAVNTHRYINGASGPWTTLVHAAWLPPVNLWVMLAVEVAGWTAIAVLGRRVCDGAAVNG